VSNAAAGGRRPLEAERGLSTSFDVSRTDGPLSYTATLFASRIRDPLHVEHSPSYDYAKRCFSIHWMQLAGIALQACSFNQSDISPCIWNQQFTGWWLSSQTRARTGFAHQRSPTPAHQCRTPRAPATDDRYSLRRTVGRSRILEVLEQPGQGDRLYAQADTFSRRDATVPICRDQRPL
jgi:hypothetical protein